MAGGRPTKFDDKFIKIAETMSKLGAIDIEIAEALEIDVCTLYRWKHTHKEFCNALKLGKEAANERVQQALYHRALGYTTKETKTHVVDGVVETIDVDKHYPPDSTALIFFLKNRMPEEYRANPDPLGEGDSPSVKVEFSVKEPQADIKVTNADD